MANCGCSIKRDGLQIRRSQVRVLPSAPLIYLQTGNFVCSSSSSGPPPWPFDGSVTGSEPKSKPERRLAASSCIPAFTWL